MDHLTDMDLIEWAAGRLPDGRRDEVDAHLAACAECRQRGRQFAGTWRALGGWDVGTDGRNLSARVAARARRRNVPLRSGLLRRVAGAAAAIVLAAAMGHLAGQWRLSATAPDSGTSGPVTPDEAAVTATLHLHAFGIGSPAGLSELVLDDPPAPEQEGN